MLVYAGDPPPGVFYLVAGEVRLYDIARNGDEIVLHVYKPGSFFPTPKALMNYSDEFFYEAGSAVVVRLAPVSEFIPFLKKNPQLLFDLFGNALLFVNGLMKRLRYLMKGSARELVLFELLLACKRFGSLTERGYFLNIPEEEFAMRTGLSRETVSREMRKLEKAGCITIGYRNVTITNIASLEDQLGHSV
jgi:CRP-like cAMP-binding protein